MPRNEPVRRSGRRFRAVAGAALLIAAAAAPVPAQTPQELDTARRDAIAAARDARQQEGAVAALARDIDLFRADAGARRRGLDETRAQQAQLLASIAHLARNPPARLVFAREPIDRIRSELLIRAALPALRAQGRALSGEIERSAALTRQIAAKRADLEKARQALAAERLRLAELAARRQELTRRLLAEDPGIPARVARIAREAGNMSELIKAADAATERRDRELLARVRRQPSRANPPAPEIVDPTRPREIGVLGQRAGDAPQPVLVMPVVGSLNRRFGESGAAGAAADGIGLAALAGGTVVAPSDGRVVYAGQLRNLGLVLIIRHGGLYHSLLAGLDRVDSNVDHWVLAGEPVGAMPGAAPVSSAAEAEKEGERVTGGSLYFELRRDGRPVDPQPWLAPREDRRDDRAR